MPPMTFPHQRTVNIHREVPKSDFLGIKNENWKAAARDLSAHAFKLYIYLASNADKFTLALSPAAVRQEIGMARSTYHDQFHVLVDKGYLVNSHGNIYEFYEKPYTGSPASVGFDFESNTVDRQPLTAAGQQNPQAVVDSTAENTEININNTNTINCGVKKQVSSQPIKFVF